MKQLATAALQQQHWSDLYSITEYCKAVHQIFISPVTSTVGIVGAGVVGIVGAGVGCTADLVRMSDVL